MDDLEILVLEPRESLEVELKSWLDLSENGHKASLAKEMIALANHGGGHIVIGIDDKTLARLNRPDGYVVTTDDINGIVARYSDPEFHCELRDVANHPVIVVPGGHKVPIKSKRNGPNGEIAQNAYYIRRPGPKSEAPQNGLEWDQFLRRCIDNREAELEAIVNRVLRTMDVKPELPSADPVDRIKELL